MLLKMEKNVLFVHGIGNIYLQKIFKKTFYLVFVLVVRLNQMIMNFYIPLEISLLNGNHRPIIFGIYQVVNK
jgi:hypothetical protein